MNNYKKSLARVREQAEKKGYRFYTVGGDGVNNCSSLFINSFEIKTNTYDAEDMEMLAEVIEEYDMPTVREVFCDKSITYTSNEYVKDSYKNSQYNLLQVLDTCIKGAMISKSKVESIEDAYISKSFSVDSAFLYGEYYVTPYIIIATLNKILENDIQKELLCKFINHYMDKQVNKLSKKDINEVSCYLFKELFLHNNKNLIQEIDNMKIV